MGDLAQRKGGTRLGSYEIVRKLARGGMAELFLAKSVGPQGFEKLVTLKKILPQYARSPRFVRLFLDEAKLAAGFQHPNIAHVFDLGAVDDTYFFAMEFVHGQDVRTLLHRAWETKRAIPIDLCVQVVRQVASALHYAHEQCDPDGRPLEIVHRDVSPSNIMLSYDGSVKLLDFGVAKAQSSSTRTRTGTLKGKVSYMSPEQAKGAPVDRRSDVFSLGIVLWELLTGTRLFRGANDLATIQMIVNEAPAAPSTYRDDCPPELDLIVQRALATAPDARLQTAQQLQ
ncbi:MAG: serine/threonine-protein kinase, partial [Proteobacteria bacterium]|nr:serine/threonine-protein kinase [Pseudomonadota bacterium]